MDNNKKFLTDIEPNKITWWHFFWKVLIWLWIWWIITALLFIILSTIWWVFNESLTGNSISPILPIILILIWFVISFIGNLWVLWMYNLFFSKRYHNITKTIWILLLTNWILFILLVPVYLIFSKNINTLFIILWFHIIISTFLSSQQIETCCNPNYSSSALIWNTLSLAIIMLIYWIIWKTASLWDVQSQLYLLLLFPPILAFSIMPLWLSFRELIYTKIYEMWNNCFYVPSRWEMNQEEKENIEIDTKIKNDIEEDINIDLN